MELFGLQNATLLRGEIQRMFQHFQCAEALNSLKFNVKSVCGCAYFKACVICQIRGSVLLQTFQTAFRFLPILFSQIIVSGGT